MQTCPWSPKVPGPRPEVSSCVRSPEALTSHGSERRWRGLRGCGAAEAPLWSLDLLETSCSALALLVARVGADDDDPAVTAGNLAVLTDLLDAGLNLHRFSFFRSLPGRTGRE